MSTLNQAAEQIIRAQSIINDLTSQSAEIQSAMSRQQALVDQLMPFATWGQSEPEPEPEQGEDNYG